MIRTAFSFSLVILFIAGVCSAQSSGNTLADFTPSPLDEFHDHCANCHGYEGINYQKTFKDLKGKEFRNKIEDMMFGPAFLSPTKSDIDAMVAYNKAIQRNVPFAIVINAKTFSGGKDDTLRIEGSSDSEIGVRESDAVTIKKDKTVWKIVPRSGTTKKLTITITRKGVSSSFVFPEELWSR